MVNDKIDMYVSNTVDDNLYIYQEQIIQIVNLKPAGYNNINRDSIKIACMKDFFSSMKINYKVLSYRQTEVGKSIHEH